MSLKIAISKGRVLKAFVKRIENVGYSFDQLNSRKLMISSRDEKIQLITVKSLDVPLYVKNGYADLGIVGSDVIDEYSDVFYEIYDLNMSKCDLCIAGKTDLTLEEKGYLKIATKYPKQGRDYLKDKKIEGEVIKLNGSVELGPLLGISDCILDIVETGNTLKENNLIVKEVYKSISSRIIANKIFYKTKNKEITEFLEKIDKVFGGMTNE